MKLPAAEHDRFSAVMRHYGLTADEVELCKQAYRREVEAGHATYQELFNEINWRQIMNKGITERIKQFQELKRAMLAKAAAGPGQPEKPLRPPRPVDQPEPQSPVRDDPPKEAA